MKVDRARTFFLLSRDFFPEAALKGFSQYPLCTPLICPDLKSAWPVPTSTVNQGLIAASRPHLLTVHRLKYIPDEGDSNSHLLTNPGLWSFSCHKRSVENVSADSLYLPLTRKAGFSFL